MEINKFWKLSQYQLETSVDTIISTFRGLLMNKDKEIRSLKEALKQYEESNDKMEKEMFNRCIRVSVINELEKEKGKESLQSGEI